MIPTNSSIPGMGLNRALARPAANAAAATVTRATSPRPATEPYFDVAEPRVRALFTAAKVDPAHIPGKEFRGLCALLGKGIVTPSQATAAIQALAGNPKAVAALLDAKSQSFMDQVVREHGVRLADGKGRWSVQELANIDYLLGQMPETFLSLVRQGPPLKRGAANDEATGVYAPLPNSVTYFDGMNASDDATLAAVKRAEPEMRTTMLMEIGHAWHARNAAVLHPGFWSMVETLVGLVFPIPDRISEWARISGWTVRPKFSLASLFGRTTPNLSNGNGGLHERTLKLFGKEIKLDLTGLRYDPAKEGTFVSEYAKTDPFEDFGESIDAYFTDPRALKAHSPAKYAYIRDKVMDGREFDNAYGLYR